MEQEKALDQNISFGMLIRFALPTILSSVFMSVYTTVDGIFVSRFIDTHEVEKIYLKDKNIHPCMACGYCCSHEGNCVFKDRGLSL